MWLGLSIVKGSGIIVLAKHLQLLNITKDKTGHYNININMEVMIRRLEEHNADNINKVVRYQDGMDLDEDEEDEDP